MSDELSLLRAIELAYDGVENPSAWTEFLKQFASLLGASLAYIQWHHLEAGSSRFIAGFGMESSVSASYNERYGRMNVWRQRGAHRMIPGHVVLDHEMCSRSVLEGSEFFNDYLVPLHAEHNTAGVVCRELDRVLTLGANRGRCRGAFGEPERATFRIVLPHATRAITMSRNLQRLNAAEDTLDDLGVALLFLTARGHVVHGTPSATGILARNDGVTLCRGALRAVDSTADAALSHAVREAGCRVAGLNPPLAVSVPRSSGRAYQVLCAPMRHGGRSLPGLPAVDVVLLVIDPERHQTPAPDLLVRLYGLTRREAVLASRLAAGRTVDDVAKALDITYETARTHLRRIFDKTDTSRQVELVLLLSRVPHATRPSGATA